MTSRDAGAEHAACAARASCAGWGRDHLAFVNVSCGNNSRHMLSKCGQLLKGVEAVNIDESVG